MLQGGEGNDTLNGDADRDCLYGENGDDLLRNADRALYRSKALGKGLHVLVFSDNVSLEDEVALKRYAAEHGLRLLTPEEGLRSREAAGEHV